MSFKKQNIVQFLETHLWEFVKSGNLFDYYKPPRDLKLDDDFLLEIPIDSEKSGFQKYSHELVNVVYELYHGKISHKDLTSFFTQEEAILSLRIVDEDTVGKNGVN